MTKPITSDTPPVPSDLSARRYAELPTFSVEQLFGKHHEILIRHKDEHYRLRITRQGKLILTK